MPVPFSQRENGHFYCPPFAVPGKWAPVLTVMAGKSKNGQKKWPFWSISRFFCLYPPPRHETRHEICLALPSLTGSGHKKAPESDIRVEKCRILCLAPTPQLAPRQKTGVSARNGLKKSPFKQHSIQGLQQPVVDEGKRHRSHEGQEQEEVHIAVETEVL